MVSEAPHQEDVTQAPHQARESEAPRQGIVRRRKKTKGALRRKKSSQAADADGSELAIPDLPEVVSDISVVAYDLEPDSLDERKPLNSESTQSWPRARKCFYMIPLFGPPFAPTNHPESGLLTRFSNENTIILFPVLWRFLNFFDQNWLCYRTGRLGYQLSRRNRCVLMMVTLGAAVLTAFLLTLAVFGNSLDPDTIRRFPWAVAEGRHNDVQVRVSIGLFQRVIDVSEGNTTSFSTRPWEDGCAFLDARNSADYCTECHESMVSSFGFMALLLIGQLVGFTGVLCFTCAMNIPTMVTSCQRGTRYGDMNCQKFLALVFGLVGIYIVADVVAGYYSGCYMALPLTLQNDGLDIPLEWSLGTCWHMFVWAGILKICDFLFHLALQAPTDRQAKISPKPDDLGKYLQFGAV